MVWTGLVESMSYVLSDSTAMGSTRAMRAADHKTRRVTPDKATQNGFCMHQ